jgi:hypothetical protein
MKTGSRKPPKGYRNPLEASYRHFLETPFHTALQKVRAWVVRLIGLGNSYISRDEYHQTLNKSINKRPCENYLF